MDLDKNRINMKDVMTSITAQTMKYMHGQIVKSFGDVAIQWAIEYGADIPVEQREQALDKLAHMVPTPGTWPSLEVKARSDLQVKVDKKPNGPVSVARRGPGNSRKAADFPALIIPDGKPVPKCKVKISSGTNKGNFCGKNCVRVLDEHDIANDLCRNLECGHMFCGQHIAKAGGGDEIKALDRLKNDTTPIVSNGVAVDGQVVSDVSAATESAATNSAMAKILAKVKSRKDSAPVMASEDDE